MYYYVLYVFLHISLFLLVLHEFVLWAGGLTLHNKQYLILSYILLQSFYY